MKSRALTLAMIVLCAFCLRSVATPQNTSSAQKIAAGAPVSGQLRPLPQSSGINITSRSKGCTPAHARPGNVERGGRAVDSEISCALIEKLYQARNLVYET
jgi:hypothetical protein